VRKEPETRDLLDDFKDALTKTERAQIKFVRGTFDPGPMDKSVRVLQRYVGANWLGRNAPVTSPRRRLAASSVC
jgi:hypothetical protein